MYLHIPPCAPHALMTSFVTSLTHPRKILLLVLQIGNRKNQRLVSICYISLFNLFQRTLKTWPRKKIGLPIISDFTLLLENGKVRGQFRNQDIV
jgi:hypothetical protein